MFETVSKRVVNFRDLEHGSFVIEDIAHGLSHVCRFAGQLHDFYSVAQHSLVVTALVAPEHQLAALLHDASEAYVCDLPAKLKRMPELAGYRLVEHNVQRTIYEQFGVPITEKVHSAIKLADAFAACWEQVSLREGGALTVRRLDELSHWFVDVTFKQLMTVYPKAANFALNNPLNYVLTSKPADVKQQFLAKFKELHDAPGA